MVQLWKLDTGEHRTLYEDVLLPEIPLQTRGIQFNEDGSEIALALSCYVEPPGEQSYAQNEIWRWDTASGAALSPYVLDCDMRQFNYRFDYGLCPSKEYNTSGYILLETLALAIQHPRALAQKMAYCLREMGVLEVVGKQRNALLYRKNDLF